MSVPMSREQVVDRYFLEMRAKVLEVAASLDRIDRSNPAGNDANDARLGKLQRAIRVLLDPGPGRAEKVQQIFSRTYDPAWRAAGR